MSNVQAIIEAADELSPLYIKTFHKFTFKKSFKFYQYHVRNDFVFPPFIRTSQMAMIIEQDSL